MVLFTDVLVDYLVWPACLAALGFAMFLVNYHHIISATCLVKWDNRRCGVQVYVMGVVKCECDCMIFEVGAF